MTADQAEFDLRCEWVRTGWRVWPPSAMWSFWCLLKQCSSGKELIERGFEEDVVLASALDVSGCAPTLVDGAYVRTEA
jgi:hypothetical protein